MSESPTTAPNATAQTATNGTQASPANPAGGQTATTGFTRTPLASRPASSVVETAPTVPGPAAREPASAQNPGETVAANIAASAAPTPPNTTATVTEPVKPPVTEPKPDDQYSQRVASLARREAKLFEESRRIKQASQDRENALANLAKDLEKNQREIADWQAKMSAARADPLKWLELGGHNYDSAAAQLANDKKPLPEQQIEAYRVEHDKALAEFRAEQAKNDERRNAELQALRDEQKRRDESAAQESIDQFNRNAIAFVETEADKYKITNKLKQAQQVPLVIKQYYQQSLEADMPTAQAEGRQPNGRILSYAEAAELVENYYVQLAQQSAEVLGYTKPAETQQPQVGAAQTTQAPQVGSSQTSPQSAQASPATVTNRQVTAPSSPSTGEFLSESERYKRALAALNAPGAIRPG